MGMEKARALMVLGTASHVGKSLLTAALCRILAQEGFRVAPFKAQNMALNSAATPDGLEIGRAQAMQAEAARVAPSVDMNPVLIKPSSDVGAQVVVRGRVWGQVTAGDYHRRRVEELFPLVCESYERLAARHDIIVLEGAGSPAEINLKARDIVNMRMAEAADAQCVLVGDIDRGGVFASLLGTLELLEGRERARVRGFIVNKFRGDQSLLTPGIEMIEARLGKPCVGVVPHLHEIGLDEEDSVAVSDGKTAARVWGADEKTPERRLRVGVLALPYMSNFTDFDALAAEPSVALAYLSCAEEVERADLLIIPGTKQTIGDLGWLKSKGFDAAIVRLAPRGLVVGVCGGMQMLGIDVADPEGMEGGGRMAGLGLLPIRTVLGRHKVTRRALARLNVPRLFGQEVSCSEAVGYEIHLGTTEYMEGAAPLLTLTREGESSTAGGRPGGIGDGAMSDDGRVIGTYLHGLFDDDRFRHAFIHSARAASGLAPPRALARVSAGREGRFDRLAAHVRNSIDLKEMLGWLKITPPVDASITTTARGRFEEANQRRGGGAPQRDEAQC
jgi:adenosylcobyric acid synthase